MEQVQMIAVERLLTSETNPRKTISEKELKELADSIRVHGVIQPITVRGNGAHFTIVAGERRFRASVLAELTEIPAIVRDLTDEQVEEIQIVENLHRTDVHPMEEATSYKRLMDSGKYTFETLAHNVGKSLSYVRRRIELLKLSKQYQEMFREGKFTIAHALELSRLTLEQQEKLGQEIMRYYGVISVEDLKSMIKGRFHLLMKEACFDRNSKTLLSDAGPCKTCPKRTGCNTSLFEDFAKTDMCTDSACFQAKTDAHIEAQIAKYKKQGMEMVRIHFGYNRKKGSLPNNRFLVLGDDDPGCDDAMWGIVDEGSYDHKIGSIHAICTNFQCEIHNKKIEEIKAESPNEQKKEAERIAKENEEKIAARKQELFNKILEVTAYPTLPILLDAVVRFVASKFYMGSIFQALGIVKTDTNETDWEFTERYINNASDREKEIVITASMIIDGLKTYADLSILEERARALGIDIPQAVKLEEAPEIGEDENLENEEDDFYPEEDEEDEIVEDDEPFGSAA